ncbi:hypothetical protein ACER0C_002953 [Sarotherodon galilaeus]
MASRHALLGVLLCSLMVSASEILPQEDFDLQAETIAGKWYLTEVCSNFRWFVCRKANMNDTCWKMETLATKTDVPGKFPVSTPTKTGNITGFVTEMRVVDGKPDEYGLNHYINTGRSETFVENRLYGRSLDLSAEEKFNQLCLQTDILPENILHLPKTFTLECPLQCFV